MLKNIYLTDHGETQNVDQKIVEMYGEYFSNIVSCVCIRKKTITYIVRQTCHRIQSLILLKHF